MQFGSPRGAERIYIKDGVMRDGRIVARKIRAYFDSGAYTRLSSYAAVKCAAHLPGPYTIPNVYGDIYCVFTNRTPATAMRGFGVTAMDFALECQMDKLAHLVGIDPMEFRILNAYRDGDMKAHRREAQEHRADRMRAGRRRKGQLADPRRGQAHVVAHGRRRQPAPTISPTPREPAPQRAAALRQQRTTYDRAPRLRPTASRHRPPTAAAASPAGRHGRRRRRTAPPASPPSSAPGGADHGKASRTRHGRRSTIPSA